MDDVGLALYVHWPWCLAKCPYCDFNAHVWDEIPKEAYLAALVQDLHHVKSLTGERRLESVFFGGGTPSVMGADSVEYILDSIHKIFSLQPETEVTVECNPTSSSKALFQGLLAAGVNRVSVGVQSLEPAWLDFLGRKHDVHQALQTLDDAQTVIGNVNADVIYGLPDQRLKAWLHQLKRLVSLGLPHVSCYQLTVEPQTKFFGAVKRGEWAPLDMDIQADFMRETAAFLGTEGFTNYEISNFSKPGRACRHNVHVWQYGDYAGVGAGAHGRLTLADGRRVATRVTKHPRNYLKHATATERLSVTPVSDADAWLEAILSGLRLKEGIDVPMLESRLGGKLVQNVNGAAVAQFRQLGLLEHTCKRFQATFDGWMVLDSILSHLSDLRA